MQRFKPIPNWVYTGKLPAFYDTESGTAIEQTARLHGTIKGLIDDYNKFVNELNTYINEFINSTNQDQDEFKAHIDELVHNYIEMLDEKIKMQDKEIDDSIGYIKENLNAYVVETINAMRDSGELEQVVADAFEDISTRITSLENDNTTNKEDIANLKNDNKNNKSDIENLTESIETLSNDLKAKNVSLKYYEDTKELNLVVDDNEIIL